MISIILFFVSVFCIIYYGVIISYSGIRTSFVRFWPLAAVLSALFAVVFQSHFYTALPSAVHLIVKVLALIIFVFFLILLIKIVCTKEDRNSDYDYLIVLGAIVRGETPSHALEERIQTAYDYLSAHPKSIAILTGYQNPQAKISQGTCMQRELRKLGIPAYRLLVEPDARTTTENFQFSKDYMTKLHPHAAVITSDFHLYRAMKIAKKCGYENIKGIKAKTPTPLLIHCYVRELFAIVKNAL